MLEAVAFALIIQAIEPSAFMRGEAWDIQDNTAALDQRRTVMGTLISTTRVHDIRGKEVSAMLVAKCQDRDLSVYVAWPGAFFGSRSTEVAWRVNDTPIRREWWTAPQGAPNASASSNPRRIVEAMETGGELVMRVGTYAGSEDVTFKLGDSRAVADRLKEACP